MHPPKIKILYNITSNEKLTSSIADNITATSLWPNTQNMLCSIIISENRSYCLNQSNTIILITWFCCYFLISAVCIKTPTLSSHTHIKTMPFYTTKIIRMKTSLPLKNVYCALNWIQLKRTFHQNIVSRPYTNKRDRHNI